MHKVLLHDAVASVLRLQRCVMRVPSKSRILIFSAALMKRLGHCNSSYIAVPLDCCNPALETDASFAAWGMPVCAILPKP